VRLQRPAALVSQDGASWTLILAAADGPMFADVGGQAEAKQALTELIVWPRTRAEDLRRLHLAPSRGVLLHGPPGTGKTLLARAAAQEAHANFLSVSIPDLIKGDVGATERLVSRLFATAKASAPCVVFFDEAQAVFAAREDESVGRKLVSQFLVETDALQEQDGVVLLAATNLLREIDSALLRPGRFDRVVFVGPLAEVEDRVQVFAAARNRSKHWVWAGDVDPWALARAMPAHVTGAMVEAVCRRAHLEAVVEGGGGGNGGSEEVGMRHFWLALKEECGTSEEWAEY
jgi:transitional endoplasmic reticulum ATPase